MSCENDLEGVCPEVVTIQGCKGDKGDKGDITVSASGATYTIDNGVVTPTKMSNITGLSVLGRASNTSGVGGDITAASDNQVLTNYVST